MTIQADKTTVGETTRLKEPGGGGCRQSLRKGPVRGRTSVDDASGLTYRLERSLENGGRGGGVSQTEGRLCSKARGKKTCILSAQMS